jgi:flagellar basal body-associated protein FliL
MKYLEIFLAKAVKDLHNENGKMLLKEIKEDISS